MNLLLDTNAFIWLTDNRKIKNLGKQSKRIIENSVIVYVSSLTLAELHMKSMLGKMKMVSDLSKATMEAGIFLLDFTAKHADAIQNFPSLARHDPFDRMLLAQAYSENLTLLTSDKMLLGMGLHYVVNVTE